MDIKISDLLTAAGVTGLPGRTEGSPERVREAVTARLKEEKMNTKKRPSRLLRTVLIAAAVAAALAVAGIAYNMNFGEMSVGKEQESVYRAEPRDVIEIPPADSPVSRAFEELDDFRREVQSKQPVGSITQEELEQIMADNERIRQKYFELAGEYGLKPGREATSVDSVQELGRSIHNSHILPPDDPRATIAYGAYTDIGTIEYIGGFTLPGGGLADYGIGTATKGTMSRLGTAIYLDELEEWDYTTADGTNVLLGIAERKSLLYVELEHCYVLAVIRAGYEGADSESVISEFDWNRGAHTAVTRDDIEYFADNIDLAAIDAIAEAGQK